MAKELSLYVHIPFCVRKCLYCDFLSFYADKSLQAQYFEALAKEIRLSAKGLKDRRVISIFFGGGTPSFPKSKDVCGLLNTITDSFNVDPGAEISIEVNPASAMKDKLADFKRAGFNRLSIGAQSLDDRELKILGRAHDSAMFYHTFESARQVGFGNINVDIMSALPGQSLDSYLDTVQRVIELKPEHISAYSLILEEGTPFYEMELDLPDEELDRRMYHETGRMLTGAGYHRYEISNYSRDGYECRHNKVYWRRGDYLGLGLGAASLLDETRWSNTRDMKVYMDCLWKDVPDEDFPGSEGIDRNTDQSRILPGLCDIRQDIEELDIKSRMEEFMFLGLRLTQGVSRQLFSLNFGRDMEEVYGDVIRKYTGLGLLEWVSCPEDTDEESSSAKDLQDTAHDGEYLRLTERGLDVSNTVMADFLLD